MQTEFIVLNEERNVTLTAYLQPVGGERRGDGVRRADELICQRGLAVKTIGKLQGIAQIQHSGKSLAQLLAQLGPEALGQVLVLLVGAHGKAQLKNRILGAQNAHRVIAPAAVADIRGGLKTVGSQSGVQGICIDHRNASFLSWKTEI